MLYIRQNSATPLIMAAQNGHREIVDELLKKKADVNAMNNKVSEVATPI